MNGERWTDLGSGIEEERTEEPCVEGAPPVYRYETIDSTNSEALRLGEAGAPHGTAVVSRYQTAGRGKLESRWLMPRGEGVLLSILLRRPPEDVAFPMLTLRAGQSIAELLRRLTSLPIEVKHPNDLIIGGRKLAGILSEARWLGETLQFAVVGVGINVNVSEFPEEIRPTATSLAIEAGKSFDVGEITDALIIRLRTL